MPLHGKDPFEFYKCRVKPGEEYFEIKFTKEHFKRYKDYIERYELYMEKIWTCSITGRKNLSFEEALLSEKLASEKVSKLPELILPHCLEFIQYKDVTLEELTTQLYDFLITNYFPGEIVAFKKNNLKYVGRIIEHIDESEAEASEELDDKNKIKKIQSSTTTSPQLNSNNTDTDDDIDNSNNNNSNNNNSNNNNNNNNNSNNNNSNKINKQLYSDDEDENIEIDEDIATPTISSITSTSATTSTTSSLGEKKVNRKYLDPRKKLDSIKKYYKIYVDSQGKTYIANVKDIIRREPPIYKPMVKDTIKSMSKKTKHLGGYWEVDPQIMRKFNLDNIPVPSHLKREVEQNLKKKRQLEGESGDGFDSDVDFGGRGSAEESASTNVSDLSDSEQQRKRRRSKYPIEDQELERDASQEENPRPIASSNFICHPATYGDCLMVWHFLNHFEKVISLTPFSLDDFELALQHHTDNPILVESHVRLLKIIFTLPSYSTGTPKKTFSGKLTDRNWFATLKAYFQYEVKRKAIEEKEKQANLKQVEQNNKRMMILANELPGTDDEDEVMVQDDNDKSNAPNTEETKDETMAEADEKEQEEEDAEVVDEEEEEDAEEEEEEIEQDVKFISSPDPNIINKVLKKKGYFKLSVDERIYILAYLVQQTIASDKIRKHLDKIVEVSNEIKQEKKGVDLEEKQLKHEQLEEDNEAEVEIDEDEEDEEDEEQTTNSKQKSLNKKKQQQELNQLEKQKEALDIKLEKYSTRLESLGRDRVYRNYWYWNQLPGRFYVENENGEWEYYSSKQEIDDLLKFLDNRGIRERKLLTNIKAKYDQICTQLEKKNKEIIEQIQYEAKRSQRIKVLYSEKSYLSYTNKYPN